MPASPVTRSSSAAPPRTASSSAASRARRSPARPTNGTSKRRSSSGSSAPTASSRYASTLSRLPFSRSGPVGSALTVGPAASNVCGPIRISPRPAFCSSRAAMLTVSPETRACRAVRSEPATT